MELIMKSETTLKFQKFTKNNKKVGGNSDFLFNKYLNILYHININNK